MSINLLFAFTTVTFSCENYEMCNHCSISISVQMIYLEYHIIMLWFHNA
jgi:hypothetical protein